MHIPEKANYSAAVTHHVVGINQNLTHILQMRKAEKYEVSYFIGK